MNAVPERTRTTPSCTEAIRLVLVALFAMAATFRIDRPGPFYDEVLFVNGALGGVDGEFIHIRLWGIPLMLMSYIGALKAWLYAPVFALFGVSMTTIRLPTILLSAATLYVLARLGERLFGRAGGMLFALLLATDPAFFSVGRVDYGPVVLMTLFKSLALWLFFVWLDDPKPRTLWGIVLVLALGLFDKLNFVWFLLAFVAAAAIVYRREVMSGLRAGGTAALVPASLGAALLGVIGVMVLLPLYRGPDPGGVVGSKPSLEKLWWLIEMGRTTLSGEKLWKLVFRAPAPSRAGWGEAGVVLLSLGVLLPLSVPRLRPLYATKQRSRVRLAAFFLVLGLLVFAQIWATPQAIGPHHLWMLFPLPLLTAFSCGVALAGLVRGRWRATAWTATLLLVIALVVDQLRADLRYIHQLLAPTPFVEGCSPAIYDLSERLAAMSLDSVVSADWGLHNQLFALAAPQERHRFRNLYLMLDEPRGLSPGAERWLRDDIFAGRRVGVVLHAPEETIKRNARLNFLAFRQALGHHTRPVTLSEAGEPLYEVYVVEAKASPRSP